jgi:hypothetical protein
MRFLTWSGVSWLPTISCWYCVCYFSSSKASCCFLIFKFRWDISRSCFNRSRISLAFCTSVPLFSHRANSFSWNYCLSLVCNVANLSCWARLWYMICSLRCIAIFRLSCFNYKTNREHPHYHGIIYKASINWLAFNSIQFNHGRG